MNIDARLHDAREELRREFASRLAELRGELLDEIIAWHRDELETGGASPDADDRPAR